MKALETCTALHRGSVGNHGTGMSPFTGNSGRYLEGSGNRASLFMGAPLGNLEGGIFTKDCEK